MNYTPEQALQKLIAGNQAYLPAKTNPGDISPEIRLENALHGQHPYAVILTCSDSRVPPEHIFSAGIGALFVVRTAGNVVGSFEIGSMEYGAEHLHAPLILVMGHTQCGAVAAALEGHAHGYVECVVEEIQRGLCCPADENAAIKENILHSKRKIMESRAIRRLCRAGELAVVCAVYDTATGHVTMMESL